MKPVIKKLTNEDETHVLYWFYCPRCKAGHGFDSRWSFNGDYVKPTFSPSLLVNQHRPESRCHSFVQDGQIQFLNDCFHDLKGLTITLEPVEEDNNEDT